MTQPPGNCESNRTSPKSAVKLVAATCSFTWHSLPSPSPPTPVVHAHSSSTLPGALTPRLMGHTRRKHQRLTTAYSLPCFSSLSHSHSLFLFIISLFISSIYSGLSSQTLHHCVSTGKEHQFFSRISSLSGPRHATDRSCPASCISIWRAGPRFRALSIPCPSAPYTTHRLTSIPTVSTAASTPIAIAPSARRQPTLPFCAPRRQAESYRSGSILHPFACFILQSRPDHPIFFASSLRSEHRLEPHHFPGDSGDGMPAPTHFSGRTTAGDDFCHSSRQREPASERGKLSLPCSGLR